MCVNPNDGNETGNHNAPEEMFVKPRFKLFVGGCRNVKHGKSAGDVEEQSSECEVPARTGPVNRNRVGVLEIISN